MGSGSPPKSSEIIRIRRLSSRPPTRNCSKRPRQQRPIADFLMQAVSARALLRWRSSAAGSGGASPRRMHWHAVLSIEMGDRAQQFSATVSERAGTESADDGDDWSWRSSGPPRPPRTARGWRGCSSRGGRDGARVGARPGARRRGTVSRYPAKPPCLRRSCRSRALIPGEMAIMRQQRRCRRGDPDATRTLSTPRPRARLPRMFAGGGYSAQLCGRRDPVG